MILTLDLGNSDLVAILYQNELAIKSSRLAVKLTSTNDYYLTWLNDFLTPQELAGLTGIILGSVVPALTTRLVRILTQVTKLPVTLVDITELKDFKALIDNPLELGADLIAGAYGGLSKYAGPLIIVDAGSATKISLINPTGDFVACTIAPGLGLAKQAMLNKIKHLPDFDFTVPKEILGRNTVDSLKAGLLLGTIGSIRFQSELMQQGFPTITKILTGGYGYYLKDELAEFHYEPDLVHEGLLAIYQAMQN